MIQELEELIAGRGEQPALLGKGKRFRCMPKIVRNLPVLQFPQEGFVAAAIELFVDRIKVRPVICMPVINVENQPASAARASRNNPIRIRSDQDMRIVAILNGIDAFTFSGKLRFRDQPLQFALVFSVAAPRDFIGKYNGCINQVSIEVAR